MGGNCIVQVFKANKTQIVQTYKVALLLENTYISSMCIYEY